jgi:hypothetical protein
MSSHYPRIRMFSTGGFSLLREGLSFGFYIRRPHQEIAQEVIVTLDAYMTAVGSNALGLYFDKNGDAQILDTASWKRIWRELLEEECPSVHLLEDSEQGDRYGFDYYGQLLTNPFKKDNLSSVCAVEFRLPTEYLEEHGPSHVRELALKLAAPLPFCFGQAGLAFHGPTNLIGVTRLIRRRCFRYPGMDIPDPSRLREYMGNRVRGPSWLTFLGQPVLGELQGAAGLRSRLHLPGTTVQELEGERAVVTLGEWPEAGDLEQGQTLPAYRELARVLEPWLYHEQGISPHDDFPPEDRYRWERRFLDEP